MVTASTEDPAGASSRTSYRPEIDGLRALAVIVVIINHFNEKTIPSGYLGVDIFFVISGFVITSSLASYSSKGFCNFLAGFYARRIKRLVPALVLFVAITSFIICLLDPQPEATLKTGFTSLFGFSNLYLLRQSTDYFATSTELNTFTHTWSLGVEEQFYFLFPLLTWLTGFSRLAPKGARNLFITITILATISFIAFVSFYRTNPSIAYFSMPTRIWELSIGCLLFLGSKLFNDFFNALEIIPPLVIVAAIITVFFAPLQFAVPATLFVVILTALLINCLRAGTATYNLFTQKKIVYVGLISYSLYLWHWVVLSISHWTIGVHWWSLPFQITLIFLLAVISYCYVETPLRRLHWSSYHQRSIAYGFCASVITATLLFCLIQAPKNYLYTGSITQLEQDFRDRDNLQEVIPYCNIFENETESIKFSSRCGFDTDPTQPTVYLVGDSHAVQFKETIASYAANKNLNFRTVWGNSCLFPAAVVWSNQLSCSLLQAQIEASLIKKVKSRDTVFIGNALYAKFSGYWSTDDIFHDLQGNPISVQSAAQDYSRHLTILAEKLVAKGAKVVIFLGGAQFAGLSSGGDRCMPQWFRPILDKKCFIEKDVYLARRDKYFNWVFDWKDDINRFAWDAVDSTTCDDTMCRATHYRDSNHFKNYYSDYIFSLFVEKHPNAI